MKVQILAALAAVLLTITGCDDDGAAKKPAKVTSQAAGRIVKKMHADNAYRITIKNAGKSTTIYVPGAAWNRCQVDQWYPTCKSARKSKAAK